MYLEKFKKFFQDNKYRKECSKSEIKELEEFIGLKLPESYKEYMLFCGKSKRWFFEDEHVIPLHYDNQIFEEKKQSMSDSIEKYYKGILKVPENAFIFQAWQGYMFYFFLLDEADDPAVYLYHEKCWDSYKEFRDDNDLKEVAKLQEEGIFYKDSNSFSDYIHDRLDEAIENNWLKEYDE